ncbi:MAG: sigma-70 family RNA polymerase sigma factor [Planctomycetota bacterium]
MSTPHPAEFTERWMKSRHMVAAVVRSLVRDEHHAEDVLQKVAINAATKFEQYDRDREFAHWLIGIAKRQVAQHFREFQRDRHTFDQPLVDQLIEACAEVADELPDRAVALKVCLSKLNERGRDVIDMRYQQNLKPAQIADRVGASPTAVTSLLHRIRKSLEGCVKQQLTKMGGR